MPYGIMKILFHLFSGEATKGFLNLRYFSVTVLCHLYILYIKMQINISLLLNWMK